MRRILTLLAICSITTITASDILTLNNQMVFEGKVKKVKKTAVVFKMDGDKFVIPAEEIYSIQFEDTEDPVYTNYVQEVMIDTSNCMKGSFDAQYLHGKKGGHYFLGFLFGPFAIIGTALANPNPYNGVRTNMLSKNRDLFSDPQYLACYKRKAKGQLIGMEAAGWATWLLIALML